MQRRNKVPTQPKPRPQAAHPFEVRYFDQTVHSHPFFNEADAKTFYANLPVRPEDKALVRTTDNKVLL